jgi:hypothetical protein
MTNIPPSTPTLIFLIGDRFASGAEEAEVAMEGALTNWFFEVGLIKTGCGPPQFPAHV